MERVVKRPDCRDCRKDEQVVQKQKKYKYMKQLEQMIHDDTYLNSQFKAH